MKKKILILLFVVTLCLVGCSKEEEKEKLLIKFDANPTTGYEWSYKLEKDGIVKITGEYVQNEHKEDMVGVGGVQNYTIEGLKEGEVIVDFIYKRSFEEHAIDIREYKLVVDKDLKVTSEYLGQKYDDGRFVVELDAPKDDNGHWEYMVDTANVVTVDEEIVENENQNFNVKRYTLHATAKDTFVFTCRYKKPDGSYDLEAIYELIINDDLSITERIHYGSYFE